MAKVIPSNFYPSIILYHEHIKEKDLPPPSAAGGRRTATHDTNHLASMPATLCGRSMGPLAFWTTACLLARWTMGTHEYELCSTFDFNESPFRALVGPASVAPLFARLWRCCGRSFTVSASDENVSIFSDRIRDQIRLEEFR